MKKIIFIMTILTSSLFGYCYCEEPCYTPCVDNITSLNSIDNFQTMLDGKFSNINEKINNFDGQLKELIELTGRKLEQYVAIKELKTSELNELEKINSLIEKLIEQENIRIKALNIKAKTDITGEVLNNE